MERDVYNGQKEITAVFDRVDVDLVTLSDSMQSHQDKEAALLKSSEKQQKNLEEVLH